MAESAVGKDMLTTRTVVEVARAYRSIAPLDQDTRGRMQASADWVEQRVVEIDAHARAGEPVLPVYGINTGFGANAGRTALGSRYLTQALMRNLIVSHSVGVGPCFDEEIVRAAMLIRAQTLTQGYSGVRPEIVEKLLAMLNARVYPVVPSKGSLGASGDLAPLAHLALLLSAPPPGSADPALCLDQHPGEGFIPVPGSPEGAGDYHITRNYLTGKQTLWQRVSGDIAMQPAGGKVVLGAKEGLALHNGATFSAAIAALALHDAANLADNAELALSLTMEATRAFRDPFLPEVHRVRGHRGAGETAARVLRYLKGSQWLDPGSETIDPDRVPPQDNYSVRCAPQVLGAVRDTLGFVSGLVDAELNAATDNPLIFTSLPRDYQAVSCGNFHGEPLAMAMDFLGIAITELGNIAERRIFMLTEYPVQLPYSDSSWRQAREWEEARADLPVDDRGPSPTYRLPSFLIDEPAATRGMNSGLMMAQYTAASLVSDCKTLAHPDSVDSIPSSANKEDHVSMSLNAARHAREIVENIEAVIAIEILCAAQAIKLRELAEQRRGYTVRSGAGTAAVIDCLAWRYTGPDRVHTLDQDRVLAPDIERITTQIRSGEMVRAARAAIR